MTQPLIIGESIGGQPRKKYWTPDGRELLKAPNMRGTTNGGVRDANYDFGWLPVKPTELKPYCPYCDKWHDTQEEIKECGKAKKVLESQYAKLAKKMRGKETEDKDREIDTLKKQIEKQSAEMVEIKALLTKLVKGG